MVFTKGKLAAVAILSTLSIAGAAGLGTYALFTASNPSDTNTFQAGTVAINAIRDEGDTYPGPMFYSSTSDTNSSDKYAYDVPKAQSFYQYGGEAIGGWAPGDSASRTLEIISNGSLDTKLTNITASIPSSYKAASGATITGVTAASIGADATAYNEFINDMNVTIKDSDSNTVLYNGSLKNLLDNTNHLSTPVELGENGSDTHLIFSVTLGTSAYSNIMNKNVIIDFSFNAQQVAHN